MRRRVRSGWLVLALVACASGLHAQVPEFVGAAERGGPPPPDPARAPDAWLIAHLDVETTGLVPGWHEMIDLGVVLTDLAGTVRDSFFVRIQPEHPERLSPGAAAVNAFDAASWKRGGALAPAAAVEAIVGFHRRAAAGRHVLMAAYNSQFDTAFLDHLFRSSGRSWRELFHYFVLDIPSMAWALGLCDLVNDRVAERLGVADEPRVAEQHTGITGAMLNARIYAALVRRAAERGIDLAGAVNRPGAAPGAASPAGRL